MQDHEFRLGREGGALIDVSRPIVAEGPSGYTRIPISVTAPGLQASTELELEGWGGGPRGLVDFFDELAAAWNGWIGSKTWRDDHANVQLGASHDGMGTVYLNVNVLPVPRQRDDEAWGVTTVVALDAGRLEDIARDFRRILG